MLPLYYRPSTAYSYRTIRQAEKMNHVANAKIGVYCRGTKELQERAFLRGQTIPPALNLPKLLRDASFLTGV
jgi:hypothetical protein